MQKKLNNQKEIAEIWNPDQESLFSDKEICHLITYKVRKKTYKAEKVDKEEDELDKICTAAHDRTVGDSR